MPRALEPNNTTQTGNFCHNQHNARNDVKTPSSTPSSPQSRCRMLQAKSNGKNRAGWAGWGICESDEPLVVLLKAGPSAGRIAVVTEIIDHNRAMIDGPTTDVPRQSYPFKHLTLTPLALTKLPRAAGSGVVKKQLEKEATVEKWLNSTWAKKRAAVEKRRTLNDFGRFSVMLAKKQRTDVVRKALVKARKA
ncbi:60S ribosomal protein L14 [Psilocybe cubensis]|uniref:60S ribosomal protein L14 n=1 Tax=Psilocybe cubensis TaxID=181762 RepID=A0ACB8GNZ3_PSICU|nr:60S ribosomal protein L14 [Psilocybe cubensis]KAH9477294.1 60S ribosomal protein L14 [Psilocybe cubensis]